MLTVKVTRRLIACSWPAAGLHGLERSGAAHEQQIGSDPPRPQHRPDDLGARGAERQIRRLLARGIRMADDHHAHGKAEAPRDPDQLAQLAGNGIELGVLARRGPGRTRVETDDVRLDGVAQANERRILNVL